MKTLGQLSKLTGIPRTTLRYWSDPPKNGAGLLSSTTDGISGYRLFDKDALIEVLLIQIAEEAGYSIKQIREMLKSMDLFSTIDSQIDELLAMNRPGFPGQL